MANHRMSGDVQLLPGALAPLRLLTKVDYPRHRHQRAEGDPDLVLTMLGVPDGIPILYAT